MQRRNCAFSAYNNESWYSSEKKTDNIKTTPVTQTISSDEVKDKEGQVKQDNPASPRTNTGWEYF